MRLPSLTLSISFLLVMFLGSIFVYDADASRQEFGYQPPTKTLNPQGKSLFLTNAKKGDPVDIALRFLKKNRAKLGLKKSDLEGLMITDQFVSSHNQVTHVYVRQTFNGIEVFNANGGIHVAKDGRIITLNNSFIPSLNRAVNTTKPVLSAEEAIVSGAKNLGLELTESLRVLQTLGGMSNETVFSEGGISLDPIRAKLVYQPVSNRSIRLAWQIEIYELSAQHWWSARVDALSGEMLSVTDYVDRDDWGNPLYVSKATSVTEMASNQTAAPSAVSSADQYNVFAIPKESPSDGPRTLETNPANSIASPFAWHDTDGLVGPEFTVTRGNNVHAYTDVDANNVPDPGSDPDGGPGLVFDFPLDLTQTPPNYRPAAVTNLFYWNNIIHDVFYQYGFDEVSGNFQVNTYGNGGLGNDDVRAEAQDGSGTNNANFGTPVDGLRPRMQMFVWTFPFPNIVTINSPASIAGDYIASGAVFGPTFAMTGPITGDIALVNDGVIGNPGGSTSDGCEPFTLPAGSIALLDRGFCAFVIKVKNAQDAGAPAVIVANNAPGNPVTMGGADPTIVIPSLMVSQADGATFRNNLPANATLKDGGFTNRDSDLDNGVITHEYGHGISNRLTGGPGTVSCLQNAEQMGEGWSDWLALTLTHGESDNKATKRGIGTYLIFEPTDGDGIRPAPYTTDFTINDFTYADVADTVNISQPHGIGFIWSSMLWEMYWNLIDIHGFNPNVYDSFNTGGNNLAIQLVIDGMKLQVCSPGFVDGRNAILQADVALTGGANQCQIWRSFAKRGLGFSASQGLSTSRLDGVEAFDLPAECVYDFAGFFPPITNPPGFTNRNAGSTVPVKFSLGGDQGLGIFETGYPVSQEIDCTTKAPIGPLEATENPGGAELTYDPVSDQYNYPWKTSGDWEGTCRQLIVRLDDGTEHIAYFKFR